MTKAVGMDSGSKVQKKSSGQSPASGASRRRAGSVVPRKPQQARGHQRVEAILDAAAKLITEKGVGNLTVRSIAKRAHTSVGSMYFFFPDLDAVVAGLAERHVRAIELANAKVLSTSKAEWMRMSSAEVVETIITPFLGYLEANPHIELLRAAPKEGTQLMAREEEKQVSGVHVVETVLAVRNPRFSPEQRRVYAAIFISALRGMASFLGRGRVNHAQAIRELKRALTAYFDAVEQKRF